jgi:hypothetical protein
MIIFLGHFDALQTLNVFYSSNPTAGDIGVLFYFRVSHADIAIEVEVN